MVRCADVRTTTSDAGCRPHRDLRLELPHWENVLYPPGLPARNRLDAYVRWFSTAELNASFYRWPKNVTFAGWQRRLPSGFRLSVKAPRGLTHAKRLYAPEVWVDRLTSCWHELGDRRGVLLVQLPPSMIRDDARLDYFLARLPWWMSAAVEFRHELAGRHRVRPAGPPRGRVHGDERSGPAVRAPGHGPFVYVRMHGPDHDHLYAGSYSDADLRWWADRIREWRDSGLDVWVYFNNDGGGNAVRNAQRLEELLAW